MQIFSYEESYAASLDYFNNDELAAKVFVDKYALRNGDNELIEQTPTDMHWRLAKEFARIEKKKFKKPLSKEEIFGYFDKFKYIVPQGSPMAGIGDTYRNITLSNCYVVPTWDSYSGICLTDSYIANISKRRGGIGFDISNLRPDSMVVNNCARTTTGATSFMERFSNTGREVGQNNRRAALMITISIHHPDIEKFIEIKKDLTKVTGANISIRLTDEFLNAVKNKEEYQLRWPVEGKPKVSSKIDANYIWDKIIQSAHEMAEPGVAFWDNIIKESPADCYLEFGFGTVCVNPCAELPLSEYDSCRLLCLNLLSYVDKAYTKDATFDYKKLHEHSIIAQRLMDDLVDLEVEKLDGIIKKIKADPEPAHVKQNELDLWKNIKKACINGRRTGTGITALGDTIAALGLKYGRPKSINVSERIFQTIKFGCYRSSVDMAKELGAFPVWGHELEKKNPFLNRIKDETIMLSEQNSERDYIDAVNGHELCQDMKKYGRRNISLLTIAPTGSVSTQTQTTSGVEPVFMLSYTRRKKINHDDKTSRIDYTDNVGDRWQEFEVYHHGLNRWKNVNPEQDIDKSPYSNACANDLDWKARVELQGAIQKHCDHSISSTVNLPEDVDVSEVKKIYEAAWKHGLKGITVYRNNCRAGVLVESNKHADNAMVKIDSPKRPKDLQCDVHHVTVKGDPYVVFVGLLDDEPYEVFAGLNTNEHLPKSVTSGVITKKGRPKSYKFTSHDGFEVCPLGHLMDDNEQALTRMTSTALRHGTKIQFVYEQLSKTHGNLTSFAKSIARSLKKYISDNTKSRNKCPDCKKDTLIYEAGCTLCSDCGYSACS